MKIAIYVLNYNGLEFLPQIFPSIMREAGKCKAEVYLLDNLSSDGSIEYMQKYYPDVTVIRAEKNDYLFSYNKVIFESTSDYVLLMNNDVKLGDNFIQPMLKQMEEPKVFAVSPRSLQWDGISPDQGRSRAFLYRGLIRIRMDHDIISSTYALYAFGGASLYRKNMFCFLGGLNRLYYPAYSEDLDICYRAWKRGYRSIYEPSSIAYHYGGGSWAKDNQREKRRKMLMERNKILFQLENINDIETNFLFTFLLVPRLLYSIFTKEKIFIRAFMRAIPRIPYALKCRFLNDIYSTVLSDREICAIVSKKDHVN